MRNLIFIFLSYSSLCNAQRLEIFQEFKNTDSIYSFNSYDHSDYYGNAPRPEKIIYLQHLKVKDSIINNIKFSRFAIIHRKIQYPYWLGYKNCTLYFFSNKLNSIIDSISITDLKKQKHIYSFNRLNKVKVVQVMDISKATSSYVLEFKLRKNVFEGISLFRIIISSDLGPSLWLRGKDFDFESY